MMNGDLAVIVAGDAAALILAWFSGATVMRLAGTSPWRVALQKSLGLSLVALTTFLILRQELPDLFVIPLVFVATVAVDILMARRFIRPEERYAISVLISLSVVGSFIIVDIVMRATGHHLTALY